MPIGTLLHDEAEGTLYLYLAPESAGADETIPVATKEMADHGLMIAVDMQGGAPIGIEIIYTPKKEKQ